MTLAARWRFWEAHFLPYSSLPHEMLDWPKDLRWAVKEHQWARLRWMEASLVFFLAALTAIVASQAGALPSNLGVVGLLMVLFTACCARSVLMDSPERIVARAVRLAAENPAALPADKAEDPHLGPLIQAYLAALTPC